MLKQMIEMGIELGMKKFSVEHIEHQGKTYEQTIDTIFDFIQGYEDCIPVTCYFGTFYKYRPELCHIIFK